LESKAPLRSASLTHRVSRPGPQHAAATEDDRPLCRRQPLDGLGHELGIGRCMRPTLAGYIAEVS